MGLAWLAAILGVSSPIGAAAQPTPEQMEEAGRLFQRGIEAARGEQWEDARRLFEESLAIAPVPVTRFNLAGAQVRTGQLAEGAASYRRFLAEASGGRAARYRTEAERALAALEPRLAHIIVVLDGLEANDRVLLDGREIAGAADERHEVSPGAHVLTIERDGNVAARERVEVAEGEEREVTLVARPVQVPVGAPPTERPDGGGVLSSPWFWGGVGVVVVGGLIAGIAFATSGPVEQYRGNLGPGRTSFE